MTQLAIFFVEYLHEGGRKRPKHVGGSIDDCALLYLIIVSCWSSHCKSMGPFMLVVGSFYARGYVYACVFVRAHMNMHVTVYSNRGIACHFAPDQGDHTTRTVTWT